jgi:hypothetical protein
VISLSDASFAPDACILFFCVVDTLNLIFAMLTAFSALLTSSPSSLLLQMGDSWYEYMLKMWLQANRQPQAEQYRRLYRESAAAVLSRLYRAPVVGKQPGAGWAHLGDLASGGYLPKVRARNQ